MVAMSIFTSKSVGRYHFDVGAQHRIDRISEGAAAKIASSGSAFARVRLRIQLAFHVGGKYGQPLPIARRRGWLAADMNRDSRAIGERRFDDSGARLAPIDSAAPRSGDGTFCHRRSASRLPRCQP